MTFEDDWCTVLLEHVGGAERERRTSSSFSHTGHLHKNFLAMAREYHHVYQPQENSAKTAKANMTEAITGQQSGESG